MTSTLTTTTTSHFTLNQHYNRKRVLLKRSTKQINDPQVIKEISRKRVTFAQEDQVRYFYKSHSPNCVKEEPPLMNMSADDYTLSLPNWPSRNTILYNTEQKIRMENVQLVHGSLNDVKQEQFLLQGRCRAFNSSFHKIVSIRYSFDLWSTFHETEGEFRESIASTSNTWDRFVFHIPIKATEKVQSVCLALRYTVDDVDYWDNNQGLNYEIIITPPEQEKQDNEEQALQQQDIITSKKDNTKVLGRRYDFTASLTAARKPFTSPPPSPPGTPIDTETFTYTPPVFFNDIPTTQVYQVSNVKKPQQKETLITPPDSPPLSAEGFQMSYSDFVNKYCFYNSHSNPLFSTSPSAVLS